MSAPLGRLIDWIFEPIYAVFEVWTKVFRRKPLITGILSAILVAAFLFGIYQTDKLQKEKQEAERLKNRDYANQMQSLNQVKISLEQLMAFVNDQQKQLKQNEDVLATMKSEHEKFKPLIDTDRKVIDALFAAQEARNRTAQRTERWIGFALGVGASLLASIVFTVISLIVKRRRATTSQAPTNHHRPDM